MSVRGSKSPMAIGVTYDRYRDRQRKRKPAAHARSADVSVRRESRPPARSLRIGKRREEKGKEEALGFLLRPWGQGCGARREE